MTITEAIKESKTRGTGKGLENYSKQFKNFTMKYVREVGTTQALNDLSLNPSTYYRWKKEFDAISDQTVDCDIKTKTARKSKSTRAKQNPVAEKACDTTNDTPAVIPNTTTKSGNSDADSETDRLLKANAVLKSVIKMLLENI